MVESECNLSHPLLCHRVSLFARTPPCRWQLSLRGGFERHALSLPFVLYCLNFLPCTCIIFGDMGMKRKRERNQRWFLPRQFQQVNGDKHISKKWGVKKRERWKAYREIDLKMAKTPSLKYLINGGSVN